MHHSGNIVRLNVPTWMLTLWVYDERVTETSHHSMAIFATKQAHISLPHLCGAKQGSSFVCLTSNAVASLKSQAFFPPPPLNHKLLVQGYTYAFHSRDK